MKTDDQIYWLIIAALCALGVLGWLHESKKVSERVEIIWMIGVPIVMIEAITVLIFWGYPIETAGWALVNLGIMLVLAQFALVFWGIAEHQNPFAAYAILFRRERRRDVAG